MKLIAATIVALVACVVTIVVTTVAMIAWAFQDLIEDN